MIALQFTTNPGLEDLVVDEVREAARLGGVSMGSVVLQPGDLPGHLSIELGGPSERVEALALALRSVHRAVRPVHRFALGPAPLDEIRAGVSAVVGDIPELAAEGVSFRVTSSRSGTHGFTSEDAQRAAGAGVRAVLPRAVDLRGFDVELRCDVRGDQCSLGVQLNRHSLSQRAPGPYTQRTSLRGNVAWALLELARPTGGPPPCHLLDPFAGSGSLLTEAGARWPEVQLGAGERFDKPAAGLVANLAAAGLEHRSEVNIGDARSLGNRWPAARFDTIVTNPPFGKRLGRQIDLRSFYGDFLASVAEVATDDARMVVLVQKRGAFNQAVRDSPWHTRHVRVLELGGLYVGAFLVDRHAPQGQMSTPVHDSSRVDNDV